MSFPSTFKDTHGFVCKIEYPKVPWLMKIFRIQWPIGGYTPFSGKPHNNIFLNASATSTWLSSHPKPVSSGEAVALSLGKMELSEAQAPAPIVGHAPVFGHASTYFNPNFVACNMLSRFNKFLLDDH